MTPADSAWTLGVEFAVLPDTLPLEHPVPQPASAGELAFLAMLFAVVVVVAVAALLKAMRREP